MIRILAGHILDSQGCKVSSCRHRRFWSDCAGWSESSLGHVSEGMFFHVAAHMIRYSLEVLQWGTSNKYPQHIFLWRNKKNEPAHDKTYNKTCATSKDSDQPAHPHRLISRLIAWAFYSLQGIQRGINENLCHTGWMDVQANPSPLRKHAYSNILRILPSKLLDETFW